MATLIVPAVDPASMNPTLGPQLAQFITETCVFGPGSLQDTPAVLDDEKLYLLYRMYEVYPQGHRHAGNRVFDRCAIEVRKGLAKTEFAAWITFCELHPEGPVRCDGFDAAGNPVGRPVMSPYIPMMASTEEQVSELAYGVLKYVIEHGDEAHLFDIGKDRIIRLGPGGGHDGMVVPVSGAPGARDGARTTFQHFDEPHRLNSLKVKEAHETMIQNLPKRQMEHPWALYTSTAGKPGGASIEEDVRNEAESIFEGTSPNSSLFFFARWAGPEHDDLSTVEKRITAIADATGPIGEWGVGQFERIAKDYERKGVDRAYWEQVYLNRWRKAGSSAFDIAKVKDLVTEQVIPRGAFVGVGFDGARFKDSTALVVTDIETGLQEIAGLWERPLDVEEWQVDEADVTGVVDELFDRYDVWRLYADPPYWTETVSSWEGRHPDQVVQWWTNRPRAAAFALRAYIEAIDSALITFGGTPENVDHMVRHLGHAGRRELRIRDDEGVPLVILQKMDGQLENKFDAAMAGILSWQVCLDARRSGAKPRLKVGAPRRLY